jgi:hypothetical protein
MTGFIKGKSAIQLARVYSQDREDERLNLESDGSVALNDHRNGGPSRRGRVSEPPQPWSGSQTRAPALPGDTYSPTRVHGPKMLVCLLPTPPRNQCIAAGPGVRSVI